VVSTDSPRVSTDVHLRVCPTVLFQQQVRRYCSARRHSPQSAHDQIEEGLRGDSRVLAYSRGLYREDALRWLITKELSCVIRQEYDLLDLDEVAGNDVGGRSHRLVSLRPVGLAPKDGPKQGSWA